MTNTPSMQFARIIVGAAVNNRAILDNCLRRSPEIASDQLPLTIQEGCVSAAQAYNRILDLAPAGALVVFVHQDVYLPAGFAERLRAAVGGVESIAPDWAVLGGLGLDRKRRLAGRVWSTGLQEFIEGSLPLPAATETLDEYMLVLRNDGRLRFDEALPGFHLYAADIIQQGISQGRTSYAIDLPVIHHDRLVGKLDRHYHRAYNYIARKWWKRLPLRNLVVDIHIVPFLMWRRDWQIRQRARREARPEIPMSDPAMIALNIGLEG